MADTILVEIPTYEIQAQFLNAVTGNATSNSSYRHEQSSPQSTWIINHFLGHQPIVQCFTEQHESVMGDISHIDLNTTTLVFTVPISGYAILI
jgi:transposase